MDDMQHRSGGADCFFSDGAGEYQVLLESLDVGVGKHVLDGKFTLLWANRFFYCATGYTQAEFKERFFDMEAYFVDCPGEFARINGAVQAAFTAGKKRCAVLCRMPVKGGGFRRVKMIGAIREGCRTVYCAYMDVGDLCSAREEEHRLRLELAAALRQSERVNLAKSDFLSRMSHDIRTPMNAIVGMTRLAEECSGNPRRTKDCLAKIKLSAEILLTLINDVLDMSKIESGKLTVTRRPFGIHPLIRRLATVFEMMTKEKGVSFAAEISPRLAACYAGDEFKINRILMNILGNAVKYTRPGDSIRLAVSLEAAEGPREQIVFSVRDTGIGIAEDLLPRLFEPFERGEIGEADCAGSGLGLAIARHYAEALGGSIAVESALGRGSTFSLRIPLIRADGAAPEKAKTEASDSAQSGAGRRILLVEDNPINQEIAQCLLEARGFCVETADNGAEGFAKFFGRGAGYYAAVLMDIRMPVLDGLAAARKIRALPRPDAASIPIIAMSANAFAEDVEKSLAAGMNAHLSKPFEIEALMELLQNI